MAADIKIDLLDFDGRVLESDLTVLDGSYARNLSTVGKMSVVLPDYYPVAMFGRDNMLAVYRTPPEGSQYLEPGALWLVRKIMMDVDNQEIVVSAVDQMDLLKRRLVGYRPETTYADKTAVEGSGPDYADDVMKAFIRENMGSLAVFPDASPDTARDLVTPGYLLVEADKSEGPLIEEAASFKNIFDALNGVANKAEEAGTPVFFDIRVAGGSTFEFYTSINSLGLATTSTGQPITFNPENGTLEDVKLSWDYSEEYTYLYLGGPDSGLGKQIERYSPADLRDVITPFNRIEIYADVQEFYEDTVMQDIADGYLAAGRPRVRVTAKVVDSPTARYGKDFFYGDAVLVQAGGYSFPCTINKVSNKFSKSGERLTLNLVGEVNIQ